MPEHFAIPQDAILQGPSGSAMDWTEDDKGVFADSCDRIAANADTMLGREFGLLASALRENPVIYQIIRHRIVACEIALLREQPQIGEEVNREAWLILFGIRQQLMRKDADGGNFRSDAMTRSELFSPSMKLFPRVAAEVDATFEGEAPVVSASEALRPDLPDRVKGGVLEALTAQFLPTNRTSFTIVISEMIECLRSVLTSKSRNLAGRLEESIDQISVQNSLLTKSLNDYTAELRSYRDWARRKSFQ